MRLNASHSSRPKLGESANGDGVVVRTGQEGTLLAVVDALGHGPAAAEVTEKACRYLESVPLQTEVRGLLTGLHAALRDSRGAAAMVCMIRGDQLDGCGVGNVELRLAGSSIPVVLSPGILGGSVRQFRVFSGTLRQRSRIVLFSDGISARFSLDALRHLAPADACRCLVGDYGRSYDDATALVADCE